MDFKDIHVQYIKTLKRDMERTHDCVNYLCDVVEHLYEKEGLGEIPKRSDNREGSTEACEVCLAAHETWDGEDIPMSAYYEGQKCTCKSL